MTRTGIAVVILLSALALTFGAEFEGPAQGTVIDGPTAVSAEEATARGPVITATPPAVPGPVPPRTGKFAVPVPPPPQKVDAVIPLPAPGVPAEVPVLSRFFGLDQTGSATPDPALAAGLSEVMEVVNSAWAVFDKSGRRLAAGDLNGLFSKVGPPGIIYQPQVFYDQSEQRWVVSALGRSPASVAGTAGKSVWLLAVSQQSSATGPWYVWKMDASGAFSVTDQVTDDQALGYNNNLVVLTANMYSATNPSFQFAQVRVLDKRALYDGRLNNYTVFWALRDKNGRYASSVRPMRAPEGAGDFYLASVAPDSGSLLAVWQLLGTATSATLKPLPSLPIRYYVAPPNLSQRGTKVRLATGPAELQSLQYHGNRLYCTFHEFYPLPGAPVAGIRYLVVNLSSSTEAPPPSRTYSVLIDKTLGNGTVSYFNPSVAVDVKGNAYFAFNFVSPDYYAGIGYFGWPLLDTLSAPVILKRGEAPYGTTDPAHFGNVTAIALDPNADNAAWITGAYNRQSRTWGTQIAVLSVDPLRYRATVLKDHVPVAVNSDTLFKFGRTGPHWNAVGFLSTGTWHLDMWDPNFLTLLTRSSHDLLPVILTEFVVSDGRHSPLDTLGIRLDNLGADGTGTLQLSQATPGAALDAEQVNGPFDWKDGDIVRIYEYQASPAADSCFALTLSGGDVDLGMAVFKSPNAPYYANRYQAVAIADNNGPGKGEYLTFKPASDDYYAIVMWANNRAVGQYALSSACRIDVPPGHIADPSAVGFRLQVGGSGVMTGEASITYDVAKSTPIAIRVYDAGGRAVRTLVAQNAAPGHYAITWDGRSATGRTLAAGTYFVRFESKEFTGEQKIVKVQ